MLDSAKEQENQLQNCISTITEQLKQEGPLLFTVDSHVTNRDAGLDHVAMLMERMSKYREQLTALADELVAVQSKREGLEDVKATLEGKGKP